MQQLTGSKLGKEYVRAVYCHPIYLMFMQSTSFEMPGWMNYRLESRLLGEISTASDMQMIPLMAEREEELKSLLMRVKEESEKAGLKLNIQKTKIMDSGPITSWQTEGEKVKAMTDFLFLGSKITEDGDHSQEIKSYDKSRQHNKRQRHHSANAGPYSQSYGFSSNHIQMYFYCHFSDVSLGTRNI